MKGATNLTGYPAKSGGVETERPRIRLKEKERGIIIVMPYYDFEDCAKVRI